VVGYDRARLFVSLRYTRDIGQPAIQKTRCVTFLCNTRKAVSIMPTDSLHQFDVNQKQPHGHCTQTPFMESIMGTTRKTLFAAVAAALMAASAGAYAQAGPPCPSGGPGMMGWGGGPGMMGQGSGPGRGARGYGPGAGAGPQAGYGPGPRAAQGGPRGFGAAAGPAQNAELRLAYLKNQLNITAEQQPAFDAYATAVKKNAAAMQGFRTVMFQTQDPAERVAKRAEQMKQRAGDMEGVGAALKDLYAVLTPEQKTIADASMGPRFGAGAGRGPGRWR
jgi:hypothetical protein